MATDILLTSKDLILRPVAREDINDDYVRWMNDVDVNRYMETRFRKQTLQTVADYFVLMSENPQVYFMAMILKATGSHIGNIKLNIIATNHQRGEISLWIGDKGQWGKGLATQAILLVREFAINELKLHKLTAGCYSNNIGSARAFEKAGFRREAVLKEEYRCDGLWVDRYCYAFIAPHQV